MPRGHAVELGPRTFPTKTIAKAYVRDEILRHYEVGDPIDNPEHIEVLWDVLRRKDTFREKVGGGIEYFYVERTQRFREYAGEDARTLMIRHSSPDEADVDFSYESAIDDRSEIDFAKEGLRNAILDKRDAFKFQHFENGARPLDRWGDPIDSHDQSEVRYEDPTWGQLTTDFAESVGGWGELETDTGGGDAQIGRQLINGALVGRWRDYYDQHAVPVLHRKRGT